MQEFLQANGWWLVPVTALWVLPWKGWALWRAASRGEKKWFIALLVINTLGILEILYIFVLTKPKEAAAQPK